MRKIWTANLGLAILAVLLFLLDKWIDARYLLGSKVEGRLVEGRSFDEVFDGQPIRPDKIVIYPMMGSALLIYESEKTLWHYYPHVEVETNAHLVKSCYVNQDHERMLVSSIDK